ncbi:MAG: FtsX-like permease family protein [Spirochaeta sp.]|nr:FtsX-like permease family protein [Spirochaeta sp.]
MSGIIAFITAAWRNYSRNLKRYRVLLIALVVISVALVFVTGTLFGLQEAVRTKASRYFAGDLVVLGFDGSGGSTIPDADTVLSVAETFARDQGPGIVTTVSQRSTHYDTLGIELFYVGYWTRQRRLVGVEWQRERPVLADFDFVQGGVPEDGDETAVLISSATADHLGIAVGEELTISIRSDRRRINTGDYIVAGIYNETSFFGYTTYLHRRALNGLREAPEDNVNEIGLYLSSDVGVALPRIGGDTKPSQSADPQDNSAAPAGAPTQNGEFMIASALTEELAAAGLPVFPVLTDRTAYENAASAKREQRQYGVVTVGAQLAEITELLTAITIIAGAIMVLFLGIVVVGVSNTYTMVVWERTREIGTLRAMGMQRPRTVLFFLIEAIFLGGTAVVVGGALGVGLLWGVERWVTFPPNAFTTLFLTAGRLAWTIPAWSLFAIAALVIGASVAGAGRAAVRAGAIHPVEAMRQET